MSNRACTYGTDGKDSSVKKSIGTLHIADAWKDSRCQEHQTVYIPSRPMEVLTLVSRASELAHTRRMERTLLSRAASGLAQHWTVVS
ncbi:unnamed protein product [Sphagnum balticum]